MKDLETRVKSISYKLISEGVDIYKNKELDELILVKHACSSCKKAWYMNLTECFFCGCINSYLYYCFKCKVYSSTTGGKSKCGTCEEPRKKICFNEKCVSNNSNYQKELNRPKNGLMDRGSPSSVSQTHCLSCGSEYNEYLTRSVKIVQINNLKDLKFENSYLFFDRIIFVKNNENKYFIIKNKKEIKDLKKLENEIDLNKIF